MVERILHGVGDLGVLSIAAGLNVVVGELDLNVKADGIVDRVVGAFCVRSSEEGVSKESYA